MYVFTYAHKHTCIPIHLHVHIHFYRYRNTHICIYIYTCTHLAISFMAVGYSAPKASGCRPRDAYGFGDSGSEVYRVQCVGRGVYRD